MIEAIVIGFVAICIYWTYNIIELDGKINSEKEI